MTLETALMKLGISGVDLLPEERLPGLAVDIVFNVRNNTQAYFGTHNWK